MSAHEPEVAAAIAALEHIRKSVAPYVRNPVDREIFHRELATIERAVSRLAGRLDYHDQRAAEDLRPAAARLRTQNGEAQ